MEVLAQEAHCVPTCLPFRSEAFRLHHFYYGLGIVLVSIILLSAAHRQRIRWDAALVMSVGIGLCFDEIGLVVLGVPYSHHVSLLVLGVVGALLLGMVNAALRDGTMEFGALDRADIMTVLSVLLAMAGILYLDRPLRTIVEVGGTLSWVSSLILLALFGKRHFLRVLGRSA